MQLSNPVRWVIVLQMGAFFFTRHVLVSLVTAGGERQMCPVRWVVVLQMGAVWRRVALIWSGVEWSRAARHGVE